jgi:hydrogenase nickel incorporation protein HypA/HybF
MHEMSLAGGVLQVVEAAAVRERFERVACLRLAVGKMAGVEVRALRFALEVVAYGTCLEGARIEIDEPAGQGWCLKCSQTVEITERGAPCPSCGSHQLQTAGGDELKVVELLVDDEAATAATAPTGTATPNGSAAPDHCHPRS